jgi:hypothetical protein
MSQRRLRSEFIVNEPPKERTRRRFQKVGMIAILVFSGIVSCSYLNYNNQVLGQLIDIATRSINTMRRMQMSKQAKVNEETKFDVIQRKAAPLGFTSSVLTTQVLQVPYNQFDSRSLALYAKRIRPERENFVSLVTQSNFHPKTDHN